MAAAASGVHVETSIGGKPMNIGCHAVGLDATKPLSEEVRQILWQAWLDYGMIVFRGTGAGADEQIEISKIFGELERNPVPETVVDGNVFLMEVSRKTIARGFVFDDGSPLLGRLAWHRDTAFMPEVCRGGLLRLEEIPPEGGETLFADTANAYDALPDDLKQRIEGLEVKSKANFDVTKPSYGNFWKTARRATDEEFATGPAADEAEIAARFPPVVHPLVITHPDSGRKCIYFSPWYIESILGLSAEESDKLVRELVAHTVSPRFTYAHSWQKGDMVLWDNRRYLHAANGYDPKYWRTGFRTTLANPMHSGRYFEPATAGDPLPA